MQPKCDKESTFLSLRSWVEITAINSLSLASNLAMSWQCSKTPNKSALFGPQKLIGDHSNQSSLTLFESTVSWKWPHKLLYKHFWNIWESASPVQVTKFPNTIKTRAFWCSMLGWGSLSSTRYYCFWHPGRLPNAVGSSTFLVSGVEWSLLTSMHFELL